MNGIVKVVSRFSSMKNTIGPLRQVLSVGGSVHVNSLTSSSKRQFTRTIWHMCSARNDIGDVKELQLKSASQTCSCGCGSHFIHTKAEKDLVDFLTDEIATEKKTQKKKSLPANFEGFTVELNGAEVTLTKKSAEESVIVYFNVNHTVDADVDEAEIHPNQDKPDFAEMKSKPGFEVELVRGTQTLGFTCSFLSAEQQSSEDGYNDVFGIDEVTMYDGEWGEKTYAVAGEIVDGNLYDLLMNLLEEKGISNEFVEKMSDFSTTYEHNLYVGLLEKLQKFASGK